MTTIGAYVDPNHPDRIDIGAVRVEFISIGIGPLNDGCAAGVKRAVHGVRHVALQGTGESASVPKFGDREWGIARLSSTEPFRVYWGKFTEGADEFGRHWMDDARSLVVFASGGAVTVEEISVQTGDGIVIAPINSLPLTGTGISGSTLSVRGANLRSALYLDRQTFPGSAT